MPNDPAKRDALIKLCNDSAAAHDDELPAVTVERFFDGNDDLGSILCNHPDHPGLAAVRDQLIEIRAKPDVQSVLVRIHETMEDESTEDDEGAWPFAEQVLIATNAPPATVRGWFAEAVTPDDVRPASAGELRLMSLPRGTAAVVVWWD